MLEELTIAGLGVIDEAGLEFGPGLNVVTGETGAGKTMVVTALGLLLGSRADASAVRQGARRARVEGRVSVDSVPRVADGARESGADLDDGSLILIRTVTAEGRSRASAGGVGVPAALLSDLAADLVVVHGQSDQQRLRLSARQREYLDTYGGAEVQAALTDYRGCYARLREVTAELDDVVNRGRERAQEADFLRFGLDEIAAVDPRGGEDAELRIEEGRLGNADALRRAAEEARMALSGDDSGDAMSALELVAQARKSLGSEMGHDASLAALADQLASAAYLLADAAADVASYAESLETDPIRLSVVQERRARLTSLLPKYGDTIDEALQWRERAAVRLAEVGDDSARLVELRSQQESLQATLAASAATLSQLRHAAAARLETVVTAELASLAMPDASFVVQLKALPAPTPDGTDEVAFLLGSHTGADPLPLHKGASGGELSRVMLAVEVSLAGTQPVPTMIFDEVDAGVGGKAAVEVGRRLARLSRSVQVIVVTHLPQVAAFADRHYAVQKSSTGQVTTSGLTVLDEAGRRRELSRMLAGMEDSESALAHADELVQLARAERAS